MNIRIENITLGTLDNYLKSDEYLTNSFVPMSRLRALSHMNNPRADKEEYCLFLAYHDEKLIGYLGTLSDYLFTENKKTKVYWWSCLWVMPEYRRHSIAMKMLFQAYNLLEGNIMITNYHQLSKFTFDKTDHYTEFTVLYGYRLYVFSDSTRIVIRRFPRLHKVDFMLKIFDSSINQIRKLKLNRIKKKINTSLTYKEVKEIDEKLGNFIEEFTSNSVFKRGRQEFQWMIDYPWVIKTDKPSKEAERYFFSQEAPDYKQWFIKVENNGQVVAFIVLLYYRGELKIPYSFYAKGLEGEIAGFIAKHIVSEGIPTLICYNNDLALQLAKMKLFFFQRKSTQGFLISKKLQEIVPIMNKNVYVGDGDNVFT